MPYVQDDLARSWQLVHALNEGGREQEAILRTKSSSKAAMSQTHAFACLKCVTWVLHR